MSVLHYASSAVSVSQLKDRGNGPALPLLTVGFWAQPSKHPSVRMPLNQSVGLLQFSPMTLPEGCRISSVRLCLMVNEPSFRPVRIGLFSNMSGFEPETVAYETRPAIMPAPFAQFQVNPDMRWKYVACDVTVLFKNRHGYLPAMGFTLLAEDPFSGIVSFCAQSQAYMPYLEIICSPREEACRECPEDTGLVQNVFKERIFNVEGGQQELHTPALTTAGAAAITFFVKNTGMHPLNFHIQISPDGMEYLNDSQIFAVEPGDMKAAVPYLFGKFMRVSLRPLSDGYTIAARVWCQAQTKNYMVKELACRPDGVSGDPLPMSLPGDVLS